LGAACRSLALRATAAPARESSPRPAAPARGRNDQRQARELQEQAILPALQRETEKFHSQKGQVMASPSPALIIV